MLFTFIDKDGNGKISKKELRVFFENMKGLDKDDKERDKLDNIFKKIDQDGSHHITMKELYRFMQWSLL